MLYWKTSLGQSVDSIRGWCNTFLFSDEMSDLFDYTRSLPGLYSWDVPGSPSQGIRDDPPEVRQEPQEDLALQEPPELKELQDPQDLPVCQDLIA